MLAKIIFNEAGIAFMGLKDPIEKTVKLYGKERQIVGVVKNFHFESLQKSIPHFSDWLDGFEFKIDLEWWYFMGAGVTAMVIAWLTVGTQAFKAAMVNPAKILRSE